MVLTREELEQLDPKRLEVDRDRGLRRPRPDRPDLLQPALLPRPGAGRRAGLRPARPGDGRAAQGRDRPLRDAQPREPGGDPRRRRHPDAGDDAIRRRGRTGLAARGPARREAGLDRASRRSRWRSSSSSRSSTDFDPSAYKDEYRTELLSLIERKAAGEEVLAAKPEAPKPTKAPDLMAALEESLAAIKGEELSGDGKRRGEAEDAQVALRSKPASKAKSKSKAKAAK